MPKSEFVLHSNWPKWIAIHIRIGIFKREFNWIDSLGALDFYEPENV